MKKSVRLELVFCISVIVLSLLIVNVFAGEDCKTTPNNPICDNGEPVLVTTCEDCCEETYTLVADSCVCTFSDNGLASTFNLLDFFKNIFETSLPLTETQSIIKNNLNKPVTGNIVAKVLTNQGGLWLEEFSYTWNYITIPAGATVSLADGKIISIDESLNPDSYLNAGDGISDFDGFNSLNYFGQNNNFR